MSALCTCILVPAGSASRSTPATGHLPGLLRTGLLVDTIATEAVELYTPTTQRTQNSRTPSYLILQVSQPLSSQPWSGS
jgi:hypothetical protein